MKPHTLKWFKNRVGKVIFRDAVSCPCNVCENGTKNGIRITDEFHAQCLYDYENSEMGIIYRDKK